MLILSRRDASFRSRMSLPSIRMAPAGHVVEARDQVRQRGLARAAGSHQGHHFPGLHLQIDAIENQVRSGDVGYRKLTWSNSDGFLEIATVWPHPAFP